MFLTVPKQHEGKACENEKKFVLRMKNSSDFSSLLGCSAMRRSEVFLVTCCREFFTLQSRTTSTRTWKIGCETKLLFQKNEKIYTKIVKINFPSKTFSSLSMAEFSL